MACGFGRERIAPTEHREKTGMIRTIKGTIVLRTGLIGSFGDNCGLAKSKMGLTHVMQFAKARVRWVRMGCFEFRRYEKVNEVIWHSG
jgi:hypothetical protein